MILGVDASARKAAGVRLPSGESSKVVLPSGPPGVRAAYEWALEQSRGVELVVVEAPVLAGVRNVQTTLWSAMVVGAVVAASPTSLLVPVSTWKKEVVGHGSSPKEAVSQWLRVHRPDLWSPDQDLCDAACVALYGEAVRVRRGRLLDEFGGLQGQVAPVLPPAGGAPVGSGPEDQGGQEDVPVVPRAGRVPRLGDPDENRRVRHRRGDDGA